MIKKAVLFDMDGLMIDSEKITHEEYTKTLNENNYPLDNTFYMTLLGANRKKIYELFYQEYGNDFPMDAIWDKVHIDIDHRILKEKPYKEGLLNLLSYLKENNYKTIVATSSSRKRVDRILDTLELTSYFDDVICGDEVSTGKPNPEIFLKACEKLNVNTSEAIVLEDSEAGILASYNANIDCICIPDLKYPTKEYEEKATILNSLTDVIAYVKGL